MDDYQPVNEAGGDEHTEYLDNEVKSEPYFSENREHDVDPLFTKVEASANSNENEILTEKKQGSDNQYIIDPKAVKQSGGISVDINSASNILDKEINRENLNGKEPLNISLTAKTQIDDDLRIQHLKATKEGKRADLRFPCTKCEYSASTANNLKYHMQTYR